MFVAKPPMTVKSSGGLSPSPVASKGENTMHRSSAQGLDEMNKAAKIARWGCLGLQAIIACFSFASLGHAADFTASPPPGEYLQGPGVPCSIGAPIWAPPSTTAAELPWRSVWLGHFSGGRPYSDGYGHTLIDWRDEKFCFPERRQCQAWVRELRQDYHRPEGYWTCLLLR